MFFGGSERAERLSSRTDDLDVLSVADVINKFKLSVKHPSYKSQIAANVTERDRLRCK